MNKSVLTYRVSYQEVDVRKYFFPLILLKKENAGGSFPQLIESLPYKLFLLIFLCSFLFPVCIREVKAENSEKPHIIIGLSIRHISGLMLADAKIAMEVWTKELASRFDIEAEMYFYEDLDILIKDFNSGKIDIGSTAPVDYINVKDRLVEYELAYGNLRSGKKTVKYLLLTHLNADISTIKSFKGSTLALKRENDLGLIFLNVLLFRNGHRGHRAFFSNIVEKDNFSKIILALFFREADFGVVTDLAFNTMRELNPQVGKKLKLVASSPELIQYISFFRKSYKYTDRIMDAFMSVRDTPKGRQFLTLYKSEGFPRLEESDTETLDSLVNEYKELKRKNKQ